MGNNLSIMKAINAILLIAGIVFVILGAVTGGVEFAIVGDILVVAGVLLFIVLRRRSLVLG